jgi:glycosyltransferase involved in cell wall biosynthesis
VGAGEVVAGLVGRVDAMKDHDTFLAAMVTCTVPGLRAVCIGGGEPAAVESLRRTVDRLGLSGTVTVPGPAEDMPAAYNGLDLLVSSSLGEGFSNVIGEAMSCGVPCVVTDVGDSARIVGRLGEVVPPKQPDAMARAIERLVARLGAPLSRDCRERIVSDFGLDRMVERTRAHLEGLA